MTVLRAIASLREGPLARFAVVGTVGFSVDAALLFVLAERAGLPTLLARVPSFLVAVVCTWLLHRHWTFRGRRRTKGAAREFLEFFSSQTLGIALNYGVFAALVLSGPPFSERPVLALAAASVAAMAVTYTLARRVVFADRRDGEDASE